MADNVYEVVSWPERESLEGTGVRMMRSGRKALVSPLFTGVEIVINSVTDLHIWDGQTFIEHGNDKLLVLLPGGVA